MRNTVGITIWLAAACFFLTSCQALTGRTAGESIDDVTITSTVKAKLVADRAVNLTRIDVDANRGVVYLTGTVESEAQKLRVQALAESVGGVKDVVNNLQVSGRRG